MEIGIFQLLISLSGYILLAPFITVLWLLNEISSFFVKLVLYYEYKGKITLVADGAQAVWVPKRPGRTRMVLVASRAENPVTLEQGLTQYHNSLNVETDPESGQRVYRTLEYILVEKYGYACWKKDEKFDVEKHIRFLDDKIYNRTDLKLLFREKSEDMEEEKPQWEILFVKRYQESGEPKTTSVAICRFHHAYGDGLSLMMMIQKHLATDFTYYVDPCRLPVKIPAWQIFLYYTSAIIFGPYVCITLFANKFRSFWSQLSSKNGKVVRSFTWAKTFELDHIRKIRKSVKNATVQTIIECAFVSAATQVLPKDRCPDNWYINELAGLIPYKNSHPKNRFTGFMYNIHSNQSDLERIQSSSDNAWRAILGPCIPVGYFLLKFCGRFPIFLSKFTFVGAMNTMVVSNVPCSKTKAKLVGISDVMDIFGFPPQPNDCGISVACTSYNNTVKISASAEENWVKEEELEEIVRKIPQVISDWAVKFGNKAE